VTRCIAYARFSTDRQTEASIVDQLRVCREFAERRGWVVAGEHVDEGISGAALGNRPGAIAAIAALGAGDVLLVNDLSRLSRSQDLAPLLSRLRHRGARVIGVQDGFDSDSRTARMQAGLSGIMSEEFRQLVGDRTRSALELRAREGRPTGGKAYGDAGVVREIFERFAGGEAMLAIASDLNRRGIPSPGAAWKPRSGTRGRWLVSALHALLRNERYVGRLVWNRSRWIKDPDTGRRIRRERPESEWVVRAIEPLVDVATWRRVQARFQVRRPGRGGTRRYLLSGLLECALCGAKLIVVGGRGHRYVCSQFHGGGRHACQNSVSVPRAIAEERILEPVIETMLSPAGITEGLRLMRIERAAAARAPNPAEREIHELERLVREGVLSSAVAAPALAEARRRAIQPDELVWPSEAAWREGVAAMREIVGGEDVEAARVCLGRVLGAIRCRPAEGGMVAELSARFQVMLKTGTGATDGRWVGSGGVILVYLPFSTRASLKSL
jgi:site-specific DNA recombinase